jgi:hypothetical protein
VLSIRLEAEEAAHRDYHRGGYAHQYLYHWLCSGRRLPGRKNCHMSVKGMG